VVLANRSFAVLISLILQSAFRFKGRLQGEPVLAFLQIFEGSLADLESHRLLTLYSLLRHKAATAT